MVHFEVMIPLLFGIAVVGLPLNNEPSKSTVITLSGPVHKNKPQPPNQPDQPFYADMN